MLHFQDISHVATWMVQPEGIKVGVKKKKQKNKQKKKTKKKTGQGP